MASRVWPVGAPTRWFLRAAVMSALPYLLVYQGVLGFLLQFLCPRPGPKYFCSELRYLETEVCVLGVFFKNAQNPGKVKIVNHLVSASSARNFPMVALGIWMLEGKEEAV